MPCAQPLRRMLSWTWASALKGRRLVKAQILALAPELDADKLAKKALENAGIKSDDKGTKALFFMSTAQAKALAELAVEGSADKSSIGMP